MGASRDCRPLGGGPVGGLGGGGRAPMGGAIIPPVHRLMMRSTLSKGVLQGNSIGCGVETCTAHKPSPSGIEMCCRVHDYIGRLQPDSLARKPVLQCASLKARFAEIHAQASQLHYFEFENYSADLQLQLAPFG